MKRLALLSILIITVCTTTAQWEWQNPLPQGNTLNDVFLIDQNVGWAVGELGTIIKTINGGETFEVLESTVMVDLNAIEFFNTQYGFAIGEEGIILESNNGGNSWYTISAGTNSDLHDICLIYPNKIWVVGECGTLLFSNNGGNSWVSQYNDTTTNINSIYFLNGSVGWAAGGNDSSQSVVLYTTDSGITWEEKTSGIFPAISVIHFVNSYTGWAITDFGYIYKTEDKGITWTQKPEDPYFRNDYKDIYFSDFDNGWAVGKTSGYEPVQHSVVIHTSDGGETWEGQNDGTYLGLSSVHIANEVYGCAVGSVGNIVRTSSSGYDWDVTCSGYLRSILNDVFFTDAEHGWAAGGFSYPSLSELKYTNDGGSSWTKLSAPNNIYYGIHFINQMEGWIAGGGNMGHSTNIVLHTDDGGISWETQYEEGGDFYFSTFKDLWFADSDHGWVVGGTQNVNPPQNPIFFQTEDGGETWEDMSALTENSLSAICFSGEDHGWIVGHETILNTVDGGQTWDELWNGIHSLRDVFFIDQNHGWVVGDSIYGYGYSDIVMRTSDGGISWDKQYFNFPLKKVWFTDNNTGYITVGNEILLYTVDGGITWEEQFINSEAGLSGIFFLDKDNGWVVGGNSTILHTSNGGAVGIEESSMPESSHLQVNPYPNPFTTSTTIEYQFEKPSEVTLTIFNHLGEIVHQVQEHQSSGKQQITWNAEGLPSGMYFFTVKAGDQVATGKVVLMK